MRGPASFMVLVALAASVGAAGCLIDRSALTAPSDRDGDAGSAPGLDAFRPPDPDVGSDLDPDIGTTDGPDARVAEPDAVETASCDAPGEPCCSGRCAGGLSCTPAGVCEVAGCGAVGAACCVGGLCFGTTSCNGTTCEPCGGTGQLCCTDGTCAGSTGVGCDGTRCVVCGSLGQPCCATGCGVGSCIEGTCRPPDGTRGGRCIDGFRCDGFATCNLLANRCDECGMSGESCCPTGTDCAGTLRCMGPIWERRCR